METRAHHVLIGCFTLALAAGVLLFALWLARAGSQQDFRLYDIVFREAVSGLTVGSAVEYNGIRVGEVENLSLDPEDPRRVLARVRIARQTPVKTDTRARLALANITGAANIQLSDGSPASPALQAEGDAIPVILADPSPIARLRVNSEELLVGITSLVDKANQLFSAENSRHLGRVLANLDETTGVIAGQKGELRQGMADLAEASRQMKATMTQAARLLAQLEAQLGGKGERLLTKADRSLASLERFSRNLDRLLVDNQQALGSGLQGMAELEPTLRELRSTLATLGEVARRLEEDPAGFLLGGEKIREFQP
jgi:phospholipid/cholesterol/gamma-HCH transport system substrate-binding protein